MIMVLLGPGVTQVAIANKIIAAYSITSSVVLVFVLKHRLIAVITEFWSNNIFQGNLHAPSTF